MNEIGDFGVYSKTAAESVHAVKDDRHAIAANMAAGVDEAPTDRHRSYLERILRRSTTGEGLPKQVSELMAAIEIKDTLGAANVSLRGGQTPEFVRHSGYDESYQPTHAATTVDIEQGLKYIAWIFEDRATAERTYTALEGDNYRNGWENLKREGKVMKAAGEIDLGTVIDNGGIAETDGMLVRNEI